MKTTSLVLILFLAGLGLRAQTPPTNMTPAQSNLFQTRLRMLTNRPAGAPGGVSQANPGAPVPSATPPTPSAPAAVVPTPVAPAAPAAPAAPPAAGAIPGMTPGMTPGAPAASFAGATAQGTEPANVDLTFKDADVRGVLDFYANLVGRTLLMGAPPSGTITLTTQSPLTKTEAIEALQSVLGMNGVALVNIGDKFVKVLPPNEAGGAGGSFNNVPENQLPDLGSYVTRIVQLTNIQPSKIINFLQPFSRMPNALTPLDDNGVLIIRDYAENVKRMLQMIAKIDVSVPAVYISEVIPIRYAMADDIANALNSLGGSGSASVTIGSSAAPGTISGLAGSSALGSGLGNTGSTTPGANQPNAFGQRPSAFGAQANPNGTPSSTNPFQRRLLNIISSAGGASGEQQPIQVFGQAKIIADERANALLIFATRQDMEQIKHVISQLDVLLAQVLIESVIIDYSLGPNTLAIGVSAAQSPQQYSSEPPVASAGGFNNGQQFYNFLHNAISAKNGNATNFVNGLGGGLSYFGNIGNYWNVALSAAAADSRASIMQTPSIQTSQAKAAQFFVGDTVPYVTSTYNYGGAYGNQSSYSQLSVGVELDVLPFINPDGLVVMQIQQEIDDLNGYTTITGVGQVPNTIKRTLKSEITVSNQDTVVLGAFIKNAKSTSRSGVPLLQDIPLLGGLFSQHNKSKQREELIVLMRPTVLETPQVAAINTTKVEQTLPGASQAYAENVVDQNKSVEAQRKKELKNPQETPGFYTQPVQKMPPYEPPATPSIQTYDTYPTMEPNGNNAQPQR